MLRKCFAFVLVMFGHLVTLRPVFAQDEYVIGAIGDSISTAFNAEALFSNQEYSWSTGDADNGLVDSHFLRLKRLFPQLQVKAVNAAIPGSHADELMTQVDRILPYHPKYITMMIGANDVCN